MTIDPLPSGEEHKWWDDANLRRVQVVICAAGCTFSGYTYRLVQQRLLDTLNRGIITYPFTIGKEFIPLADVTIFLPDKRTERMTFTYVRKTSILFVAEKDGGQPEKSDIGDTPVYPVRKKKPIGAVVYMPSCTLVGKMHGEMWQELLDTLDRGEHFLPVTNVEVSPKLASGDSTFSFAAVNKDQIVYVGQLAE